LTFVAPIFPVSDRMNVLLHRLGWSVQVPARRAAERDEEKIARWRE
jgi:putative transposase